VFRKLIPQDQFVWLKEDAKRTIGALGPARDWDVFQQDLLAPLLAARPQDPGLRALRTKARGRARIAYRAARRSFGQSDYTRFALRFGQWIEARGWRQGADDAMGQRQSAPIADFANHLLRKRYKRALSDGQAFEDLTVEQRHDLRIALKKLRYTAEFFQPLFGKKAIKPFLSSAKTLQDDLGHQHDVAVAEGLLKDLLTNAPKPELIKAAGLIIGWHTRGCQTVEASLLEDWRAFAQQQTFWT
jgi:CHAD domain-containing protein